MKCPTMSRLYLTAGLFALPFLNADLYAAPVLVSSGADSYLVADNGIVADGGTAVTSAPADTNTDHYFELGQFSGQDVGQPDSWNGDRRWGNLGDGTFAIYTFTDLENGSYDVYTSWRNAPQGNVSLAHYQISDDGPAADLDQSIGTAAFADLTLNDGTNDIDFAFLGTVTVTDGDLSVTVDDTATGAGDEPGGQDFIHADAIAIGPLPEIIETEPCDFDLDGDCDGADIDALMNDVAAGSNSTAFDLNGDAVVDDLDRDRWLADAGPLNGLSDAFLLGDANLDGTVDAQDLNELGVTWQTDNNNWTNGNFTGGGSDAADLNVVGINWQNSVAPSAAAVPEPSTWALLFPCLLLAAHFKRRRQGLLR